MRILSGIQPSGTLHLGNYFRHDEACYRASSIAGSAFYFIADLHALTTVRDAGELSENIRNVAIDFLACGLDPRRACFFRQSQVPRSHRVGVDHSAPLTADGVARAEPFLHRTRCSEGSRRRARISGLPACSWQWIFIYDSDVVARRQGPETTYRGHARPRPQVQ